MNSFFSIFLLVVLGFASNGLADKPTMHMHIFVEEFSWKERVSYIPGNFVNESGFRYGIGGTLNMFSPTGFGLVLGGESYLGAVNYKGGIQEYQTGQYIEYNSKTSYYGIRGNLDFAYRVKSSNFAVTPYLGYGFDFWDRALDVNLFESVGKHGYSELWFYTAARVGVGAENALSKNVTLFGDLCLNVLPYVSEYIFAESGELTLKPGGKIGFDFKVGLNYNNLSFSFFWKKRQFDKSDKSNGVYQPDSDEQRVGMKVDLIF